jgi:hypothetical protein
VLQQLAFPVGFGRVLTRLVLEQQVGPVWKISRNMSPRFSVSASSSS